MAESPPIRSESVGWSTPGSGSTSSITGIFTNRTISWNLSGLQSASMSRTSLAILNSARGRSFQRRVAARLRKAGLPVEQVNELDGYTHGVDLVLGRRVAIQCKSTRAPRDLVKGLDQARNGAPTARLWVCFHSLLQKNGRRRVLIAYTKLVTWSVKHYYTDRAIGQDCICTDLTWSGIVRKLHEYGGGATSSS